MSPPLKDRIVNCMQEVHPDFLQKKNRFCLIIGCLLPSTGGGRVTHKLGMWTYAEKKGQNVCIP